MKKGNNGVYTAVRLLLLRDYLTANATRSHPVRRGEIEDYLKSQGYPVEKKTVYRDLEVLQSDFGLALEYDESKKGYYLLNPPFEPYELRLMVDSVQASRFITQKTAREITAKVKKLAGTATKASLNRTSYVADRIRNQEESVVQDADKLHEAIAADRKTAFRYFHYSPDKNKPKSYSKSGEQVIVSPFALYWNNGNYYLYAYDGKKFRFYRVDRMERISDPRPEKREGHDLFKAKDLTCQEAKVFDMYSTGKIYNIKFRCQNRITHSVIDQFGKDILLIPDGPEHFTFTQPVEISPPFFAWVATFGRSIQILGPTPAVEGMKEFLQKSLDMYKNDGNT